MNDGVWSASQVIAWCLWVTTGLLVLLTWAMTLMDDPRALPLATTACCASAVAAVAQIKVYVLRVCVQIRANRAAMERARVCVRAMGEMGEGHGLRSL